MEPVLWMREGLVQARDAAASMTAVFGLLKDVGAMSACSGRKLSFWKKDWLFERGRTVRYGRRH